MALSPADFYAYSRATGAPIPEDPQERAEMAPEVLEFRRNQLKAPQQESNPLGALGTAAAAVGALAGLGFGARALMRRDQQIPKGPAKSATAGVRQVNLADMEQAVRRIAAEPAPSQAPPTRQEVYAAVAKKPESELPKVYRPKGDIYDRISRAVDPDAIQADTLITDPNTGEIFARGRSPQSFAETYVSLRPALTGQRTDLPTARTPGTFKEFSQGITGAPSDIVDALIQKYEEDYRRAEPFQYGSELSRQAAIARKNEQLIDDVLAEVRGGQTNLTDIQDQEIINTRDQFINAVESGEDQTTGRLIKQVNIADPWGQATVPPSSVEVQTETTRAFTEAPGTARPLSSQELADIAKSEMMALRADLEARGFRPGTQRFERALAQTWTSKAGLTPGTSEFRRQQEIGKVDVSLPGVIRKAVEKVEELPEEEGLQTPFLRSVVNVGPEAEVTKTAMGTAIRGASPVYDVYEDQPKMRQIFGSPDVLVEGAPDEQMRDFPGAYSALHQILAQSDLPERIDPYAQKRLAGGDPGIGVYGPELTYVPGAVSKSTGSYSAASSRQPTFVPKWLQKREGPTGFQALTMPQLMSGAEKAKAPSIKAAFEAEIERRRVSMASTMVSELLRRGRIEGTLLPEGRTVQGPRQSAANVFQYPKSIEVVPAPLKKPSI